MNVMENNDGRTFEYSIILIGCGATGSQLLPFITQLVNNKTDVSIKLIDQDHVEEKNLKNQKFLRQDIGMNKAQVLCARYQSVYPDINISYMDTYVKSKEQLLRYIDTRTESKRLMPIVIGCVDNNATRKIFNEVFYDDNIPDLIYIDSGNGTDDRLGQIVTGFKRGVYKQLSDPMYYKTKRISDGILLEPVSSVFPNILTEEEDIDKRLSCSYVSNEMPQNIATNVMAASTIFTIVNNILEFGVINSHINYFNAEKSEIISR